MDKLDYLQAVLRREHKVELDYIEKMEKRTNGYLILWALILAMLAGWALTIFVFAAAKIVDNEESKPWFVQVDWLIWKDPAEFHRKHA